MLYARPGVAVAPFEVVVVSMPQAAMLYARHQYLERMIRCDMSFNAASGNAIRATRTFSTLPSQNVRLFQCRKRQCYTRDTLSLAARVITGLRQRFSQPSRFFLEMGAFFVDTVFSKSPKTSCHPLISKGSSCPRFFVATSPVFRGKNEKNLSAPSISFSRCCLQLFLQVFACLHRILIS